MKFVKKIIIGVLVLGLLAFTAVFVLDAYNTGKIGDKAGKTAEDFTESILGTWTGQNALSRIIFNADGKATVTLLGVELDAVYTDSYNLETQRHTLSLRYNTSLGLAVERYFTARIDGDKLMLVDSQFESVTMWYTRADEADSESDGKEEQTVYNPGIEVYQKELIGKWVSSVSKNSGYEFREDSTVYIKTIGVGSEGTYNISIDATTNACVLKVNYVSVAGMNISNSYYVTIEEDLLTLTQIGAENIKTTYMKSDI